jgi:hypothetical protein
MESWLELLFNILGYGGFVVLASRHHGPEIMATGSEGDANDGQDPGSGGT